MHARVKLSINQLQNIFTLKFMFSINHIEVKPFNQNISKTEILDIYFNVLENLNIL